MPINAHPEYLEAEKKYHEASTNKEKLRALEEMISHAPSHKGAENLRAQLKKRYKKLKENLEKKSSNTSKKKIGIKKHELQCVIIGYTNTGKSSLLNLLTNTEPEIASYEFTTREPLIGMLPLGGVQIQLIENPAIEMEEYDKGLTNSTDTIMCLITEIEQIQKIEEDLKKFNGKKIIVFNKIDELSEKEKKKISETLKSKRHNFVLISCKTKENIERLKNKIFQSFDKIRVYTKQPEEDKDKVKKDKPIVLPPESTIKDVAEKILKGFSKNIKRARIWGPSSKFPAQQVGLKHKVKDLDIVEFKTK